MKPIKYFTDTHIAKAVAVQLRERGVDIVRCEEVDMAESADSDLLDYAIENERTMITSDVDFISLHGGCIKAEKHHFGIMIVNKALLSKKHIGGLIKELQLYHDLIQSQVGSLEEDIMNQLIFIR